MMPLRKSQEILILNRELVFFFRHYIVSNLLLLDRASGPFKQCIVQYVAVVEGISETDKAKSANFERTYRLSN